MSKLGNTPHIRFWQDKDGQLYIRDSNTNEKQLIAMRTNSDGSKTSRALAAEIEDAIWEFRYDHKDSKPPKSSKKETKATKPAPEAS